jgi:hypothetical protein
LRVCALESYQDRVVPTVLDLSAAAGQSGTINGAVFTGSVSKLMAGSGSLDSFVRLDNTGIEQGYNTDASPYQTRLCLKIEQEYRYQLRYGWLGD